MRPNEGFATVASEARREDGTHAAKAHSGLGYVPAIEGLRAVAVASVVLFHLRETLLPGGFTGVDVFYVISGFVVTGSLLGRQFGSIGELLLFFYARRLVRITPALVVMLLLVTLATQMFIPNAWLSDVVQKTAKWAFIGASNVALATNSDSYFSPRTQYNPFVHTWSLGVEEQFYLIFPFIMYWHQRGGMARMGSRAMERLVAGLMVASLVACAVLAGWQHRYAFYLMPARFWELGAGMLLCLTIDGWRPKLAKAGGTMRAGWLGVSLLLLCVGLLIPESDAFPFPLALLPVLGSVGAIAAGCALPESWLSRGLSASGPRLLGRLSYSLYLWHWPVFALFRWTVGLDSVVTCLAALALSLVMAAASYRLVETPTRGNAWIRQLPRMGVVGAALVLTAGAGVASVGMFHLHNRLTLSRTGDAAAWYADDKRPLDPALTHCAVDKGTGTIADGQITSWTPKPCASAAGGRLFVIGDSHAYAYVPMLRQFAADAGIPVRIYTRTNCGFLRLTQPMTQDGECRPFQTAAFADLRARLHPGDVLFIPDLRMDRLTEEFGPAQAIPASDEQRSYAAALVEGRSVLAALTATGAHVILEGPKPVFRAPAFRCADWFNKGNAICAGGLTMPRSELESKRAPILASEQLLAKEMPGVTLWDPFPILCPAQTCTAIGPEGPRFFDGDHVSGHGNDMLYNSFRHAVGGQLPPAVRHPLGLPGEGVQ